MICETCGEEIDEKECPFCGTVNSFAKVKKRSKKFPSINIKEDLPTVEEAISRVEAILENDDHYRAVKIIHGYGSSGKGGVIKDALHKYLYRAVNREQISGFIPGEEFSGAYVETADLLKTHSFLESDEDFRKANRGITVIVF